MQLLVRGEVAALPLKGVIDLAAERARLEKEMAKVDADIKRVDAKLSNADFLARAPEEVVDGEKEKARGGAGAPRQDPRSAGAAEGRGVMHAPLAQTRVAILLLWLAGVALRLTMLAVPPLLAIIQTDLQLTGTQIGILSSLPVVLLGVAALPGSLLIARFGALTTLIIGLLVTALGGALRGALPNVTALFAATIVMGAGVAVMQPALPPLVRQWLPNRIGFGSAVFTNGLLVGEVLPVALTLPVLVAMFDSGWRSALAFWSLPTLAIAAVVFAMAPRPAASATVAAPLRWWPDWRAGLTWRLGLILSGANTLYFGTNAFIPGYLQFAGHPELIAPSLTALNGAQIPASILLIMFASRIERRIWPLWLSGCLRHCRDGGNGRHGEQLDSIFCGRGRFRSGRHPRLGAGAACHAVCRRRCRPYGCRDVHHRLCRCGVDGGARRRVVGPYRRSALRISSARMRRGTAVVPLPGSAISASRRQRLIDVVANRPVGKDSGGFAVAAAGDHLAHRTAGQSGPLAAGGGQSHGRQSM